MSQEHLKNPSSLNKCWSFQTVRKILNIFFKTQSRHGCHLLGEFGQTSLNVTGCLIQNKDLNEK